MDICLKFGKRVRKARKACGLSQEALAHEADSNRTYISDVERGTRNPSIEVVERIARALNVTMGSLLD
jgi:transcriptional regulator with XRE-family HTH domain